MLLIGPSQRVRGQAQPDAEHPEAPLPTAMPVRLGYGRKNVWPDTIRYGSRTYGLAVAGALVAGRN
jgi:hypothetical protein